MSQGNPPFPSRNVYAASSSKLPDRTGVKPGTTNPPQAYSQSQFGRRPDQPYQFGQSTATQQQQQQRALGGRQTMEKESNALSELSEEQRDEINEAVCARHSFCLLHVADTFATSSRYLTSTETAISTTTKSASPCDRWASPYRNPKSRN